MSKRLQVLLPDDEMEAVRKQAKLENLSIGEYVRRALRESDFRRPSRSAGAKLSSIRQAVLQAFPTADIDRMNSELKQGYQN
jgi:hypothetical protein